MWERNITTLQVVAESPPRLPRPQMLPQLPYQQHAGTMSGCSALTSQPQRPPRVPPPNYKQRTSCDGLAVEGGHAPKDLDHGLHEARVLTSRGERASLSWVPWFEPEWLRKLTSNMIRGHSSNPETRCEAC